LVQGILRHFNVPEPSGDVPRLQDAASMPVPATLTAAMRTPFAREWAEAVVEEWLSLVGNNTWVLTERRPWMKVIPCRWVLVVKTNEKGEVVRLKARLVAGGHRQVAGVDYDETFAPVARLTSMRMLFALGATNRWEVHSLDIKTAFLNGDIDTDVYMMQPPGFVDGDNLVAHLQKSLYGLKQAPRLWYEKLADCLIDLGLEPCAADSSLWVGKSTDLPFFLATIVDDMAATSPCPAYTVAMINRILAVFKGTQMGIVSHFNGVRVVWLRDGALCVLLQPAHIDKLVATFGDLADLSKPRGLPMKPGLRLCKSGTSDDAASPPLDVSQYSYRALIGSLSYISCCTRPDITYAVNQLARYSNAPTVAHWQAAVDCLRYLVHTKWWGIVLGDTGRSCQYFKQVPDTADADDASPIPEPLSAAAPSVPPLPDGQQCVAYADANHGVGIDDRRSVTGTLIQVLGGPVSWASKVQATQAASTVESEVHAMSAASREALWVAKLADKFGIPAKPFLVRADSSGAVHAVTKYTYTKHSKHIGIHQDFLRDRYRLGDLDFQHITGDSNPADIFTKALGGTAFQRHRSAIGMMELAAHLR
jgi:hypothetical protein